MITYILLSLPIIILIVLTFIQSKAIVKYKKMASEEEREIHQRIQEQYKDEIESYQQRIKNLKIQQKQEVDSLDNINQHIEESRATANRNAEQYYNQCLATVEEQIKLKHEQLLQNYQKVKEILDKEYEQNKVLKQQELEQFVQQCDNQINIAQASLDEVQKKVDSTTEVARRAEAEQNQKDFYRIQLSAEDIEEIQKIRSIEPFLRNKEPLNKIIWKYYYEKPVNEMIGRVIGPGIRIGIYKITNIENGKCYIGQSTNLSDRWKQHVKKGIGADGLTRNKLYPAMLAIGPENFTFEIIEECKKEQLDEREDYQQQFFHAIDYGYSIK